MIKLSNPINEFDFGEAGHSLLAAIREGFWNADGYFAKEKLIGVDKAFLWPYGGHTEAVAAQLEVYPDCGQAKQMYLDTLFGLFPYQVCRDDGHLAYAASNGGAGDIYYDDNVWLSIIFMNAYRILGDDKWLDLSKRVTDFCYSGWDEKAGGGVYWQENHKTSKNTCINAPLAKVSAELYKVTKKDKYLDWAKKLYKWTEDTLMDPDDFLYWDNVNLEGKVDKTKYSYNTGCMIGAGAHLFDITGEECYLSDAVKSADSSLDGGFSCLKDGVYTFKGGAPWFNTWLLDGYMALYPFNKRDEYILSFASAVSHGVLNCKTGDGYISPDWHTTEFPKRKINVLDQSGTARVLFDVQCWKNKYGK